MADFVTERGCRVTLYKAEHPGEGAILHLSIGSWWVADVYLDPESIQKLRDRLEEEAG